MKANDKNVVSTPKFLKNGGEMGRIIDTMEWDNHPLGIPENWPLSLRMTLSNVLRNAFPGFILWGKEYFCFYNDAYRPSLGISGKHPTIVGQRFEEAFPELVDTLMKEVDLVWETGNATWHENQLVTYYRNGKMENVYWTFSYSVLVGDNEETEGILITCIETTEAVKTLNQLKESENQLAFAIDVAEFGTWDYDPGTDSFQGNDRLMDWLGLSSGESLTKEKALEAIVPKDKERILETIQESLDGINEGRFSAAFSIYNKVTNEVKIVRGRGKVRFSKENSPFRFNGTLQDISEQVRYEEKLKLANAQIKEEEKRFRNIVLKAPVGIAIFKGRDLVIETANNGMLKFVDREVDNFIGKKLFDTMPEVKNTVSYFFEEVYNKQTAVRGTEVKIPIKRKGEIKNPYFNFIMQPITIRDGEVEEIMLVTNEVTKIVVAKKNLAESESQFRKHLMDSPIAMAILRGRDFTIEMANKQMLNHLWGRNWEEVKGRNLIEVFPELKSQKYLSELQQVLDSGLAVKDKASKVTISIDNKNQEFYLNYHYLPLSEDDGSISGVIVTATDVTEQVLHRIRLENFTKELESQVDLRTNLLLEANEKLQGSIVKLENANEELQSFAYVSSHDLQEPLRKIQMYISVILENEHGNFTEKGKKYFDKITFSARRMRTLIDDLLTFSRSNDDITKYEKIDLNLVLEQVQEGTSTIREETNAKITIKKLPEIEGVLFQMRQVFSNLINNAIKFAKKGVPPEITISALDVTTDQVMHLNLKQGKRYFAILIADNGIGIQEGMEGKIFEIFQRLHGRHEYEGTGIGLAIVRKIINNHGGTIKTKSVEGEGTTFTIYLPEIHA